MKLKPFLIAHIKKEPQMMKKKYQQNIMKQVYFINPNWVSIGLK